MNHVIDKRVVPAGESSVFRWFPEALFRLTDVRIGGHADLRLSYVTVGTIMLARFALDTPIAYQDKPITVIVENRGASPHECAVEVEGDGEEALRAELVANGATFNARGDMVGLECRCGRPSKRGDADGWCGFSASCRGPLLSKAAT